MASDGPQHRNNVEAGSSDISVAMCKCMLEATTSYIGEHKPAITNVKRNHYEWKPCPKTKSWCGKPACTLILRTMLAIPVLRLPSSTASSNQPTQNTMVNARFSGHRMIVESHRKKSSFLVPFFSFLLNSVANNVEKTWVSQGVEASNLVKVIQAQQLSAGRGQTCGSL